MKNTLLATAAACLAIFSASATESVDTLMSVKNASAVLVTESPGKLEVTVRGTADDPDFAETFTNEYAEGVPVKIHQEFIMPWRMKRQTRDHFDLTMLGGVSFGFVDPIGAPASMCDVSMGKSYEISLPELLMVRYHFGRRHSIGAGAELTWRNYRMTANNRFVKGADGAIGVEPYPDDVDGCFSRLKTFTLGFPVAYHYFSPIKLFGKQRLRFMVAVSLNWNSHGSLRTKWIDADGRECNYRVNNIGQRKFSTDLSFAVGIRYAALYVKYSPMDVLSDGRGPSFKTLSTGIRLGF